MSDAWRRLTLTAGGALKRYRVGSLVAGVVAYPALAGRRGLGIIHTEVTTAHITAYGTHDVDLILQGMFRGEIGAITAAHEYLTGDTNGRLVTAKAYLTVVSGVANADIDVTAVDPGLWGRQINITLTDPAGNNQALAITTDNGVDIDASLATDGGGAITTTATLLIAAINAHADAKLLVVASLTTGHTGAGVVIAKAQEWLANGGEPIAILLDAAVAANVNKPIYVLGVGGNV